MSVPVRYLILLAVAALCFAPPVVSADDIVFSDDFNYQQQGSEVLAGKWNLRSNPVSRTAVISGGQVADKYHDPGSGALEIACWTPGSGSQTGGLNLKLGNYNSADEDLGDGYNELYIRYYIKFGDNYTGVRNHGGNLGGRDITMEDAAWVGMAAVRDVSTRGYFYSGVQPRGEQGSTELEIGFYSYHLDKKTQWGENYEVSKKVTVTPGRWYCVERHMKLNSVDSTLTDPAVADGIEELWIDGQLTIRKDDVRFRRVPQLKITFFSLETYYHGLPEQYGRDNPIEVYFDDLVISRSYIGPNR